MRIRISQVTNKAWLILAFLFPLFSLPYFRITFDSIGLSLALPVFYLIILSIFLLVLDHKFFNFSKTPHANLIYILFAVILLFVLYHILSSFFAKEYMWGVKEVVKIIFSVCAFFIVYFLFPRDIELLRKFWLVVVWSSALLMAFLVCYHIFVFRSTFLGCFLDEPSRNSRNQLTGYFLYVVPFAFSYFILQKKRLLTILPFFIILFGIVYSGSRGTLIASIVSIGYIFLTMFSQVSKRSRVRLFFSFFGIILFFSFIIILFLSVFSSRDNIELDFGKRYFAMFNPNSQFDVDTYDKRLALLSESWQSFVESPLLGQGLSNAPFSNDYEDLTHNDYMGILQEMGLLGLIFFFALLFLFMKIVLYSNIRNILTDIDFLWIGFGTRGVFVAVVVFLIFMNFYTSVTFWLFLALSLVTIDIENLFFCDKIRTIGCDIREYR